MQELKSQGPKDIAIAIAGNKADLEDQRVSAMTKCLTTTSIMSREVHLSMYVSLTEYIHLGG